MTRSLRLSLSLLLFTWMGVHPLNLLAQEGLSAVKRSDLTIGNVVVGQSLRILPQSPLAAKFEVRSTTARDIVIHVGLPSRLQEIGGRSELSVTFGPDCARWSLTDNVGSSTSFDPHIPLQVHLEKNQSAIIWLGAFVEPPSVLQAGRYIASITLTATPVTP